MVFWAFCFLFFSSSDFIEKALVGLTIIPIGLSKLHFTCPVEHFEGKMPFLKQKLKIFSLRNGRWAKNLNFCREKIRQRCENGLYRSRGHFVDLFLHNSCCSFTFRHWRKSFWTSDGNFLSGILKFRSTCPGFFRISSPKNCFFPIVSGFWLETVRTFVEEIPVVSLRRHSLCLEQKCEENGFLKKLFSFYHFRTLIEKQFGWFSRNSRELSKLQFRCPEELFLITY